MLYFFDHRYTARWPVKWPIRLWPVLLEHAEDESVAYGSMRFSSLTFVNFPRSGGAHRAAPMLRFGIFPLE